MANKDRADLQRRMADAQEVFGGLEEAILGDYEAKDPHEIVTLGINASAQVTHCRIGSGWKGRGGVAAIERAMIDAWAAIERQLEEAMALEIAERQGNVTGRKAFVREEAEDRVRPERTFTAPASQQVYGVVDDVLAAVKNVRRLKSEGVPADQPSTGGRAVITVTDPSGKVTARLDDCTLTALTIDESWAERTSPIVMGQVFGEVLNAALDEWAEAGSTEEPGEWQQAEAQLRNATQRANAVLQSSGLL